MAVIEVVKPTIFQSLCASADQNATTTAIEVVHTKIQNHDHSILCLFH